MTTLPNELANSYLEKAGDPSLKEEKPKRAPRRGPGCRFYGCGCLVLILLSCCLVTLGTIYVVTTRPPVVWGPLKTFLNKDLKPAVLATSDENKSIEIVSKLENGLSANGKLKLTEQELATLIAERVGRKVGVEFVPGSGKIFVDLDPTSAEPLWVYIEIAKDNLGKVRVTKVGTGQFVAPQSLNDSLTSVLESLLFSSDSPLRTILNSGSSQIKDIVFTETEMEVTLNIKLTDILPLI